MPIMPTMDREPPRAMLEIGIESTESQLGVSADTVSLVMLLYIIALAGVPRKKVFPSRACQSHYIFAIQLSHCSAMFTRVFKSGMSSTIKTIV